MKTHFGDRAFSAAGPLCWNSLPPVIHLADSVDSFKAQLNTHLFAKAYPIVSCLSRRPCSGMAALLRHINCCDYYYYYYFYFFTRGRYVGFIVIITIIMSGRSGLVLC